MKMNAINLLTAFLFAWACTSVSANEAKHDDHGSANDAAPKAAAPAKSNESKPAAEIKPSEIKPAEVKPAAENKQVEAKPSEEVKTASGIPAEARAKPAPKKKKPVKKLAKKAKQAAAHADAGHASPDANGDKVSAHPDEPVAPLAASTEPSKRLKLKKAYPGGTPVSVDSNTVNVLETPAAAPLAAAVHDEHASVPTAAPAQAAAPVAADTHVAQSASAEPQVIKRLKPKASITGSTEAVDSHATKVDQDAPTANDHTASLPTAPHDNQNHMVADAPVPAARAAAELCDLPLKSEIAALFDRWNNSLKTGDPRKVVANYAPNSILLPTVSNRARFTVAEKEDYFMHFLMRRPEGSIDDRLIEVDCNSATDAGLYTFRFVDGTKVKARYSFAYKKIGTEWLITSHHSSAMPESAEVGVQSQPDHSPSAKAVPGRPASASEASTKGWVRYP
jgi:hypothetical protein